MIKITGIGEAKFREPKSASSTVLKLEERERAAHIVAAAWKQKLKCTADPPSLADLIAFEQPGLETDAADAAAWLRAHRICKAHGEWRETQKEARPDHPLIEALKAWRDRPKTVQPETRRDKRILPAIKVSVEPEREAGMLFGGLHDGRQIPATELPLFLELPTQKSVPILDLVDMAGVPVMMRGRGAPIEQRLFVRTLATVKPEDRQRQSVRMALTLRELRDGLYPNGWNRTNQWPEVRRALTTARNYGIHDGRGTWFPLALRYMPENPDLNDLIVLDIAFPPDSSSGPSVDLPEMDALSVASGARWRAYIAAHCLTWQPGTTRVKHPKTGHWVWSRNVDAYPVVSKADQRRLAFGANDGKKHRTKDAIANAWRDLPGLRIIEQAVDAKTGEVGLRLIPADVKLNNE